MDWFAWLAVFGLIYLGWRVMRSDEPREKSRGGNRADVHG